MKQFFSPSYISAGFVAILVGYTSAAAIVFQAAIAAGATADQVSSWMWALGVAMGVMGIALSVYYRHPIMIAWSTPGAALMVTSLPGIAYSDAIGAFLFCSLLITISGLTGWFDKIMKLIPQSLATAMLAGVLLQFSFKIFPAFETETLIVAAMLVTYILAKWQKSTYAIPLTFSVGVILALLQGKIDMGEITLEVTTPVWTMPTFDMSVLIGIGLPLFIVTMASQNVPGIAALRAHGYQTPASPLIGWTGAMGLAFGPFGGYAYNMAAITAALCMSEDVHPDPKQRYFSTIWVGIFYLLAGIFGATVAGFFTAFPQALVGAIAGLALLGTIANSLHGALADAKGREAAILTFVITASGGTFLTIGAPFWGLVVGLVVYGLNKWAIQRG